MEYIIYIIIPYGSTRTLVSMLRSRGSVAVDAGFIHIDERESGSEKRLSADAL